MELEESFADFLETVVSGAAVGGGKDVVPDEFGGHGIEHETAEKSVFGVGDEVENLLRRTRQDGGKLGAQDFNILMILFSQIGNGFMVEGLAEAVGVVAKVGVESVGQGVAFGLKEQADAFVFRQSLIDDGGGAVGWDEQGEERRFLGWTSKPFLRLTA